MDGGSIIAGAVTVLVAVGLTLCGFALGQHAMYANCQAMGSFVYHDNVFDCKERKR